MIQNRKWNFLRLDSFDIEIPFSKTRTEIIKLLREKNVVIDTSVEMQVVIKSKLLSLDIVFYIVFQFDNEKLISITMSPNEFLEGNTLHSRYKEIQTALEKEFGHSCNMVQTFLNLLDPDSCSVRWQKNGIKIEHYLLNRFGMEEIVRIKL